MNHPTRRRDSALLKLAKESFGSRSTIRREEMHTFLVLLAARGADLSADGYAPAGGTPTAWADACKGITVISLIDGDPGAPASINQGGIRYDHPGQMYAGFHVTLMFAPASLRDHPYDQIGQLRRYCRRLFMVRD